MASRVAVDPLGVLPFCRRCERARARRAAAGALWARTCPQRMLVVLAVIALVAAVAIGVAGVVDGLGGPLCPSSSAGAFIVVAYNLLSSSAGAFTPAFVVRGRVGAFPALTGYWINALAIRPAGLLVAAGARRSPSCTRPSLPVRDLRRRMVAVAAPGSSA